MRRSITVAVAFIALVVVLSCAGALYQIIGAWRDSYRFPQRGRLVQAGSARSNLDCNGKGNPVVILESGSGVPALGWINVQPQVATFTRVCSYDRAGFGWSDPGPEPRTSLQISKELKTLLDTAGEKGPYVLVGHSIGGMYVRVFTGLYPTDVVGMVLVDASAEDEEERMNELLPAALIEREKKSDDWNDRRDQVLMPLWIHLGIERLQVAMGWGTPRYLSKELRQELLYLGQQSKSLHAEASETNAASETIAQVRSAGNLGDRPLIVLTAGRAYDPDLPMTKDEMEKEMNLWINVLQVEQAHLSTRGRQIVVPDTGHMIPYERPDAIISAIQEVWSAVHTN